jgi:hypothetical protein
LELQFLTRWWCSYQGLGAAMLRIQALCLQFQDSVAATVPEGLEDGAEMHLELWRGQEPVGGRVPINLLQLFMVSHQDTLCFFVLEVKLTRLLVENQQQTFVEQVRYSNGSIRLEKIV